MCWQFLYVQTFLFRIWYQFPQLLLSILLRHWSKWWIYPYYISFLSLALCIALLQILLDNSWSIRSIPIGPSIEITTNQWLFYVSVYLLFFTKVISNIAFLLFAPGTLDDVRRRVSQTDLLWMCVRHYICVLHGGLSHMASNPSKKTHPRGATGGTLHVTHTQLCA